MKPYNIKIGSGELNVGSIVEWSFADKGQDLHFQINSMGGDLHTSLCLMRRMIKSKRHIITESFGQCQSGAFSVFCGGDERISHKESMFMFHSGGTNGQSIGFWGHLEFLNKVICCYHTQCKRLAQISNKPYKFWFDMLKSDKNYYFTGKEMYKLGVVNKLL